MMSSGPPYGGPVDTETFTVALERTRRLRLALNVLWDGFPEAMPEDPFTDILYAMHDQLSQAELKSLCERGVAEHYLIIRPLSHISPPPPHEMERITAAVRTLAELGMLAAQNDAAYRDED